MFFSIHAWFLFLSREKTQIEAIRLFRVYASSKNGGDQREVSFLQEFSLLLADRQQLLRVHYASVFQFPVLVSAFIKSVQICYGNTDSQRPQRNAIRQGKFG